MLNRELFTAQWRRNGRENLTTFLNSTQYISPPLINFALQTRTHCGPIFRNPLYPSGILTFVDGQRNQQKKQQLRSFSPYSFDIRYIFFSTVSVFCFVIFRSRVDAALFLAQFAKIPALGYFFSLLSCINSLLCLGFCLTKSFNSVSFLKARVAWRCGQSTRLSPMWPGFDSQTRRHMWVEFVGSLVCSERFFPGYSGIPLSSKTYIS